MSDLPKDMSQMAKRLEQKREKLRRERPVDLQLLSFDELPHFVGYDYRNSRGDRLKIECDYDDPPFHCQVSIYQECKETGVTYRFASARILDDEIVDWETHGVPDEHEERIKTRVMIIYRLLYPEGLSLEEMERKL